MTDYNYYLDPFLINKDLWDSLPAEDQQLFLDCGKETNEWGRVEMWNLEEEYAAEMEAAGVQFHEPTEEEKEKLYDLGQVVWESMSDTIDQKALELILATQQ